MDLQPPAKTQQVPAVRALPPQQRQSLPAQGCRRQMSRRRPPSHLPLCTLAHRLLTPPATEGGAAHCLAA